MPNDVAHAGAHDTAHIEATVLEEVFIFNGYGCFLDVGVHILTFDRNTLYGVKIFPEKNFTGFVIVLNAASQLIARDIGNVRKILTEVCEYCHEQQETNDNTGTKQLKGHD